MALHRNDPQVEGKDAYYRCVAKPMETVILLSSCYTEILDRRQGKTIVVCVWALKSFTLSFFSFCVLGFLGRSYG